MHPPSYVARFSGPFAALVQATTLAGMRVEPLPAVRVRDVYWDTPEGALLAAGWALRTRSSDDPGAPAGARVASLRPLRLDDARAPTEVARPAGDAPPSLDGPLGQAVSRVLGDVPGALVPLVALRQFRTPRLVFDGARPAAVVSLDVVVIDGADGTPGTVSYEAQVDATPTGGPADWIRLEPALREHGLEPARHSKFERAVRARPAGSPLRLLPDERDTLGHLAVATAPEVSRHARAVLALADGRPPSTVAVATGLDPGRLTAWIADFAVRRMAAFESVDASTGHRAPAASSVPTGPTRRAPISRFSPVRFVPVPASRDEPDDPLVAFLEQFAPGDPRTPLLTDAPPDERGAPPAGSVAGDGAPSTPPAMQRPRPVPASSLSDAAAHVLSHALDALHGAIRAFVARPRTSTARDLAAATASVVHAVDAFAPAVPTPLAERLVAGLRPLHDALLRALDAERAALLPTDRQRVLLASRDLAVGDVRARLASPEHRDWTAMAQRLVDRLRAQAADGVGLPDDVLPALTLHPSAPVPTRLRHQAAALLGRALARLAACDDAVAAADTETAPETAGHLADAAAAVAAVARLLAPTRPRAADGFAAAAAAAAEVRDAGCARRLAGRPSDSGAVKDLHGVWEQITAPALREALREVLLG